MDVQKEKGSRQRGEVNRVCPAKIARLGVVCTVRSCRVEKSWRRAYWKQEQGELFRSGNR